MSGDEAELGWNPTHDVEDVGTINSRIVIGDETMAEALRIAERHLIKMGWKFTPDDVALAARKMTAVLVSKWGGL